MGAEIGAETTRHCVSATREDGTIGGTAERICPEPLLPGCVPWAVFPGSCSLGRVFRESPFPSLAPQVWSRVGQCPHAFLSILPRPGQTWLRRWTRDFSRARRSARYRRWPADRRGYQSFCHRPSRAPHNGQAIRQFGSHAVRVWL